MPRGAVDSSMHYCPRLRATVLSTVPRGTVLTILPNRHEIYVRPKVTLRCLFINLFRKFVSDIWKVFNSCINLIIYS